jgi:hypothetical protein
MPEELKRFTVHYIKTDDGSKDKYIALKTVTSRSMEEIKDTFTDGKIAYIVAERKN